MAAALLVTGWLNERTLLPGSDSRGGGTSGLPCLGAGDQTEQLRGVSDGCTADDASKAAAVDTSASDSVADASAAGGGSAASGSSATGGGAAAHKSGAAADAFAVPGLTLTSFHVEQLRRSVQVCLPQKLCP